MQYPATVAKLFLLGAVALVGLSCGASTQSHQPEAGQPSDVDPAEDSGTRLSGEFDLSAVEDAYRTENSQKPPNAIFSFDENGNFKRQDGSRVEEGAYLLSTRSELVVYIEKVNGEPLAAARVEHYLIVDHRDNSITLQSGPSKTLVLRER
jgi:hypothetical protein